MGEELARGRFRIVLSHLHVLSSRFQRGQCTIDATPKKINGNIKSETKGVFPFYGCYHMFIEKDSFNIYTALKYNMKKKVCRTYYSAFRLSRS